MSLGPGLKMGPRTQECPRDAGVTFPRVMLRRQDGQIVPL